MDHRRRILDHLEKSRAENRDSQPSSDPQLKIPLVGEVRQPANAAPGNAAPAHAAPAKRRNRRLAKPVQPKLGEFSA